ncbi:MAG: hypothetical protein IT537_03185 [Hyphomicrobiales bacterium]|nr:hypothetical protein [Hyphomicrobiales bacterium]
MRFWLSRLLAATVVLAFALPAAAQQGMLPSGQVLGNATGSNAPPRASSVPSLFDFAFCATNTAVVQRGASNWACTTVPTIATTDNLFTLKDNGDTTKQLQLELSGISTATTRTLTVPNDSTTIVGTDVTQSLTNKSFGNAVSLTGGATGAAPTPQLSFSDYLDNAGNPSISHLQLFSGFGFGIASSRLSYIVPAANVHAFYTANDLANPLLQITDNAGTTSRNDVLPAVSGSYKLGSATLQWSDLYLKSGATINWSNGDVLLTHASNALAFSGASSGYSFDSIVSINANATALPAPSSGSLLHLGNADGTNTRMQLTAFGAGTPALSFVRALGTNASPSALTSGLQFAIFGGFGYGATQYANGNRARITFGAAENWTDTAHGTFVSVETTPNTTVNLGEVARWTDAGQYLVGHSSAIASVDGTNSTLTPRSQVHGLDAAKSVGATYRWSDDAGGAGYFLNKSRGATVGSFTIVQSGDVLGAFQFNGADGTNLAPAAAVRAEVDATPGSDDMPGRLVFGTTADGAATVTDRLILDSAGAFKPATSGAVALGTASLPWGNHFLAAATNLDWGNGDVAITHSTNTLSFTGAANGYSFDGSISGGAVSVGGALNLTAQTSPAQITSNQNNYALSGICSGYSTYLINADAARDITGLAGGTTGCTLNLVNNGSFSITLKDQSGSSTAANQFKFGADFALSPNGTINLIYDGTASRWRTANSVSSIAGTGTVTSVTCGTVVIVTNGTCNNGRVLLRTITGGGTDYNDTTNITATYAHYQIELESILPATNTVGLKLEVHSGGSYQTTTYLNATLTQNSSGAFVNAATDSVNITRSNSNPDVSNTASNGGVNGILDIYTPTGTTGMKFWRGQMSYYSTITSGFTTSTVGGAWNNTAALDGFRILFTSGNITSGTVRIYGVNQ